MKKPKFYPFLRRVLKAKTTKQVDPPEGSTVLVVDARELAHLLAGIRLMQADPGNVCAYSDIIAELVDAEGLDEMTNDELEALAGKLNR